MTNETPNVYEALDELKEDVLVLQVALTLLAQKLYPSVKVDKKFWDEVFDVVKQTKKIRGEEEEEEEKPLSHLFGDVEAQLDGLFIKKETD
jgi:hypothetical protein